MSDQKQTASELLREFQDRYHSTGYVREPLLALDRLVAAVRAEALEEAATLVEIYVGSARAARVPRAIRALVSK